MGGRPELSERETQVLDALARGLTMAALARELWLAMDTCKTHRTRLYRKLGAHTGAHAVAIGYQTGLLELPEAA
jgi:two-component system nitrate/nitrite response regulator NarL